MSLTVTTPSISPPVIPTSQGKGGGLPVLKVGSFVLLCAEDALAPNLGEPQAAPWQTVGISRWCGFSCGRWLLGGEELDEPPSPYSCLAVEFLPHHGAKGGPTPRLAWDAQRRVEVPQGLPRGAGCAVLPGLGAGEPGLSRIAQRRAASGRKRRHADLQRPSRALHRTAPHPGRAPRRGRCPAAAVGEPGLGYKARGPVGKRRDAEEILFSPLRQPKVWRCGSAEPFLGFISLVGPGVCSFCRSVMVTTGPWKHR